MKSAEYTIVCNRLSPSTIRLQLRKLLKISHRLPDSNILAACNLTPSWSLQLPTAQVKLLTDYSQALVTCLTIYFQIFPSFIQLNGNVMLKNLQGY